MKLIAEHFRTMSPQQKDRLMQIRLAEARGQARNGMMLFDMTAMMLHAHRNNPTRIDRCP
jgi:hypothetical protein